MNLKKPTALLLTVIFCVCLTARIADAAENYPLNSIVIKIEDIVTHTMLGGARFEIYYSNDALSGGYGTLIATVDSDSSGVIVLSGIPSGYYIVRQTVPSNNYHLSINNEQHCYIKPDGTSIEELVFSNYRYGGLLVYLSDKDTGEPVAGATFSVTDVNGAVVGNSVDGIYMTNVSGEFYLENLPAGDYKITQLTAAQGYAMDSDPNMRTVRLQHTAADQSVFRAAFSNSPLGSLLVRLKDSVSKEALPGAVFHVTLSGGADLGEFVTGAEGTFLLPQIARGTYIITQITAPAGFLLESAAKTQYVNYIHTYAVDFTNRPKSGLYVTKYDAASKAPLKDAVFKVYQDSALIGTYTTNADGAFFIPHLTPGWYTVSEYAAPQGYILDDTPKSVQVVAEQLHRLEFENSKLASLQIIKTDEFSGEPLAGARFRIATQNGQFVADVTTDASGKAAVPEIAPGWYVLSETKAPTGYLITETARTVEVKSMVPTVVTITNRAENNLEIIKLDFFTRAPLVGATFKVEHADGANVGTYHTDSAGKILVGNLPEGAYVVSEIQAPAGYMLDNAPQTIVIEGGKLHNMEFLDKPLSGIEIQKLNAVTQAPLSGATFVVERDTGEKIGTYQTDAAGKIIVPDLEAGTYIVSETVAPAGYILDARPQTAIVKSGRLTVVEFLNHPLSGIEIIKTDAYTHAPLSGAEFIVERPNGERVGKYLTDIAGKILVPDLAEGVYIVSETQSPAEYVLDAQPQTVEVKSGRLAVAEFTNKPFPFLYIKKVDASTGQLVAGAQFTVTNANGLIIANVTSLASGAVAVKVAPGVYTVTEIKAPDGYELNNPTQTVEVFADGHTADHASGAATAGNSADFANKPLNTLEIVKLDAATKNPLPGAMFTVDRANGERVGAYRTDASGKILIPDITEGTYVISETAAPDGYILSESPKSVNIQGGKLVSVEFLNKPLSGIEIVKLDAVTHAPLTGAAFTVTKADGERIGTFRTEADGKILVPDLDEGVYVVGEIQAPDGYLIDETPKNVTVKSGRLAVVEFVNSPLSGVQILKVDSVTKIPLKDARFTVYRQSGAIVGTYATDAAGMIIIDRLEPGWYKAAETKAPDGYIPDGTARDFEIASGQFIKLIFENKPLASLQIRKIDAISGEPLSGAVFEIREQGGAYIAEVTTDASGSASVAELEPNWYVIAEIKAPQGYILDGAAKTVEVKAVTPTVVTVANQPLSGIEIIKLDAATHVPLPDATFTVERPDGERIGTYQTDAAGKILVPDLTEGTYIISETLAPNGYILDAAPRTVIVQSGKLAVAEFVNNPLAGLKIIKLDSATRSPIEGVEFAVSKMDGERVEDEFRASAFKTDSTGQIFIPRLANGYYNVTETKAADGYLPDSEPKTVLVESGKTTLLEVLNTPMNGLLIVKTDESTGSSLAGVVFDVRRADGQFVTGSILDGNQPDTEANSPNRAASPNGDITGSYTTDAQGRILINGLPAGVYHITERQTLAGYELDTNVHSITVTPGKLAALQLTNRQKAGFRLLKIDSVTRRGIYGVEFMVFDGNNKVVGNYTTDDKGVIDFDGILTEGRYTIRETRPAEGYYADDMPRTVEFKSGRTTEIVWENTPEAGQIQITKKSADDNAVNGFPAGTLLQGAVFEIYDRANNLVDTVKSDKSGLAVSKALPIGRYTIRESQAPAYYSAIRDAIETEIEFSGQIVRLAVLNSSAYTHVSVVKRGYTEVVPGQSIRYDFKDIGNNSTASLDSFYWRDTLPTDAVRLDKIITGTWSARLSYKIVYKTNVSSGDYRTLSDNLITDKIRTIDASPAALGLASNEYVTEFMFVFGRVPAGFKQIDAPYIYCNVLPNLAHEYRFANKTDVGGLWGANQWVMANDRWVTVVYSKATPQVLPRTGY